MGKNVLFEQTTFLCNSPRNLRVQYQNTWVQHPICNFFFKKQYISSTTMITYHYFWLSKSTYTWVNRVKKSTHNSSFEVRYLCIERIFFQMTPTYLPTFLIGILLLIWKKIAKMLISTHKYKYLPSISKSSVFMVIPKGIPQTQWNIGSIYTSPWIFQYLWKRKKYPFNMTFSLKIKENLNQKH